jgi:hypothetical protein
MRLGLFAVLFIFVAFNHARADVRIEASNGGAVDDYFQLFDMLSHSGQHIVIDGHCYSACTLVLSKIPHDRICVTPRAVLGFHAPLSFDQHGREHAAPEKITRALAASYPLPIRDWIDRHGGLTGKPIYLRGRRLAALYPHCRARLEMRFTGKEKPPSRSCAEPRTGTRRLAQSLMLGIKFAGPTHLLCDLLR